jgi:LmbE family N-acetylglucosaminyl deacetylase
MQILVYSILGALVATLVLAFALRRRAYQRYLRYDPRQDCYMDCSDARVDSFSLELHGDRFTLPELDAAAASAFLEIDVKATFLGAWYDPWIELTADDVADIQYMERSVCGIRYLNLTRLINNRSVTVRDVAVRFGYVSPQSLSVRLHVFSERPLSNERILVIAPHPDDAEIAAFGLYSELTGTVVTVTSGSDSDRYQVSGIHGSALSQSLIGRIRVLDSLVIPQFGGINSQCIANLCYRDGLLSEMHRQREHCPDRGQEKTFEFQSLRELNQSNLVKESANDDWNSLVDDIQWVLERVRPTIIVTPHPGLDPHPDHLFTTVAVCEALQDFGMHGGRFYFYVNHNRRTELWPFGNSGSGVNILPMIANDSTGCESVYSHSLCNETQTEKYLALEAMWSSPREVGAQEVW